MIKITPNEKYSSLPDYLLFALRTFLNDEKYLKQLEEQLHKTGIVLEKDNYQISLRSVNDLHEIKEYLNSKF